MPAYPDVMQLALVADGHDAVAIDPVVRTHNSLVKVPSRLYGPALARERTRPGGSFDPWEFRHSQDWIGPPGCTLAQATHVPPPVEEMKDALGKWEAFIHDQQQMRGQAPRRRWQSSTPGK